MTNTPLKDAESTPAEPVEASAAAKATNPPRDPAEESAKGSSRKASKLCLDEDAAAGLELPEILSYEEIDRLLCAITSVEDQVAARLMLFGGLRVAEACAVLVKDLRVDPASPAVFVRQGKWAKDRWAPLDLATVTMTKAWAADRRLSPDSPLIEASLRTVQRHMSEAYQKASITWGPGCHTLRHTCATWQLDKGIPLDVVRANLGHEDIATTQIYLHLDIRRRSRIYLDATRFGI